MGRSWVSNLFAPPLGKGNDPQGPTFILLFTIGDLRSHPLMSDHDLLMRLTEAEGACVLSAVSAGPLLLLYLEWESCGFKVGCVFSL